jgi:hypothetical protein
VLEPGRSRNGGRLRTAQADIPLWGDVGRARVPFRACARKGARAVLLVLRMAAGAPALLLAPWGLLGPMGALWFHVTSCRCVTTSGRLCMRAVRLRASGLWQFLSACAGAICLLLFSAARVLTSVWPGAQG